MTSETIRADLDRLALLEQPGGWNHNDHYHPYLLRHLPEPCREALEVGCGTGTFARLLAGRSRHTLGLDLSPEMVRLARERSTGFPNLNYQVADALEWPFPADRFDCIASIATLHHLPLGVMLEKMKSALAPDGVLLVLDLFQIEYLSDLFLNLVAFPANLVVRLAQTGQLRPSAAARQAWDEHARHAHYLKVMQVRRVFRERKSASASSGATRSSGKSQWYN